jgi:hypothetical protein
MDVYPKARKKSESKSNTIMALDIAWRVVEEEKKEQL